MIERPSLAEIDTLVSCWEQLVTSQQSYGTVLSADGNTQNAMEWFGDILLSDGVRVVRIDGTIVGFVTFSLELDRFVRTETVGYIHNIYVDEDYRGEGYGSALLDAAEGVLAERGADVVTLDIMAANTDAGTIYRHRGYIPHRITFAKPVESADE